jgi:hypothetical protein
MTWGEWRHDRFCRHGPILEQTKEHWRMVRIVVVFCLLGGLAGCQKEGAAPNATLPDAAESTAKAIELLDADGDGMLSTVEVENSPGLQIGIKRIDTDGDGKVSSSELEEYFNAFAEAGTLLVALYGTQVMYDGEPLAGATVTLVPEPFLKDAVKPATCVTDKDGYCDLTAEGFNYDGVQIGFYRVTISMLDGAGQELIPDRYNTNTELGIEISDAAVELEGSGVIWELYSR